LTLKLLQGVPLSDEPVLNHALDVAVRSQIDQGQSGGRRRSMLRLLRRDLLLREMLLPRRRLRRVLLL
jgi:hypothetical protein